MRSPRATMPSPAQPPRKNELLAAIDAAEVALSELLRRWNDGISAEVRSDIYAVHQPLLLLLIRARLRGQTPPRGRGPGRARGG